MLHFLFNGHDMKFLTPVMNFVAAQDDIEVKVQKQRGHVLTLEEKKEAEQLNAWADIVFCEWALGNAVWFSQHKRPGQLLVVRMHFQEYHAGLPFLSEMNWPAVDALIVICPAAVEYMAEHYPAMKDKVHLVYNPLDIVERFNFPRPPYTDFNLGFLGMVPFRKRPDLALEIFEKCSQESSCFRLRIKGKRPCDYPWMASRTEEMAQYKREFDDKLAVSLHKDNIIFDQFDPEPGRWYAGCGFILSTSDYEGSHQAVAEGMAEGSIPVIRDWEGASKLYPAKYVWHDVDDAIRLIKSWRASPSKYWAEAEQCREFATENFEARTICLAYDKIFKAHGKYRSVEEKHPKADLKLAILAYIPPGCHNGYRVRVEQFVRRYRHQGLSVLLICLHSGKPQPMSVAEHRKELERLGCQVVIAEAPWFFDIEISSQQFLKLKDEIAPVLLQSGIQWLQAEAGYCARIANRLKEFVPRLRTSFDCHGVLPEEGMMSGCSEARVAFATRMEVECIQQSDFTIFVAHAMRAHYMAKYGLMATSAIVPCCIREAILRDAICQEEVLPGLPKDRPILGYLGTMVAWQCKDEMFKLFGKLHRLYPDVYFVVLTPKPDQKAALDLLAENGIAESDFRVQELPFEKVPAALVHFNAGMMLRKKSPVNRAASPTKFGEMIAAGVPVIATDEIGDYSEDVKKNGFGLIVPFDELDSMEFSDETCKNVHDLLVSRKNEDRDFIAATSHYCRESLLWDLHAQKLVQRYWELSYVKV